MRLKTILLALLVALIIVPQAHAQDASAVVSRMDAIIKQMEELRAEFAALVSSISGTPTPAVQGASSSAKPVFTQSLANGETNEDIKRIQKLLATDPEIYPYGVASGFYGPKTEEAIKNLQGRFGLDQLGIIGPGTKALFELFFNAYPDENFPSDVLKKKPQVLGASTSVPTPPAPQTPSIPVVSSSGIESITAKYDGEEARVRIFFTDDTTQSFIVEGDTKLGIVDVVASKLAKTRAQILGVIEFTSARNDDDDEEDDFNVDVEVDGDEVTVSFEYDGDDYEVDVDSTDEDDVLDEVADEMNEDVDDLDDDLVDAIKDALDEALDDEDDKGDSDEIDSITARIANGEAEIEVEYGDGEEEEFTVEETLEKEIIEEVADELNIDEDDVEDVIEFKYEDVDEIRVEIEDGEALVFVEFEDGTVKRVRINSDDEDEIIETLAQELDEDEDDIEDWTEFEYLD